LKLELKVGRVESLSNIPPTFPPSTRSLTSSFSARLFSAKILRNPSRIECPSFLSHVIQSSISQLSRSSSSSFLLLRVSAVGMGRYERIERGTKGAGERVGINERIKSYPLLTYLLSLTASDSPVCPEVVKGGIVRLAGIGRVGNR